VVQQRAPAIDRTFLQLDLAAFDQRVVHGSTCAGARRSGAARSTIEMS
jgi:hypothetical protein